MEKKRNDPNWDLRNNIPFLNHLINCIEGTVEKEVQEKTVLQLKQMIEETKRRVKTKNSNGSVSPRLIAS